MTTNRQDIDTDVLLRTLAAGRRRRILQYLRDSDDQTATVAELADDIVTDGGQLRKPTSSDSEQVVLQHVHLPKLADVGIIEYDGTTGTVRYFWDERVEKVLAFVAEELE